MNKVENQISRMKAMMTYGLQTEDKKPQYKSVEYQREGADGKTYGIVREGTKFYIKVADKKNNVLKEDFDYIGGFRNRKDNEFSSYANALKHFDLNMISLKESVGKNNIIIESWNPDKKENLAVEATDKMRREISRQRQIMGNVSAIQETKNYSVNLDESECCGKSCCGKVDSECASTQKDNIKKTKDGKGMPTGKGGDPFTQNAEAEMAKTQKCNMKNENKPVMAESEQVLGWNENEDYLDTSHGTEVGDDAPFTEGEGTEKELKNGTVEEGTAMHAEGENQNSPEPGTNEVGDDAPFDKPVREGVEDDEDSFDVEGDGEEGFDVEGDSDDLDLDDTDDLELDDEEFETDLDDEESEDEFDDDIESRIASIEDLLTKIAEKVGVDEFEDDDLYDDEEAEDEESDDESDDDFEAEDEDSDDEDDFEVFESKNYRKMMIDEDRLDYFGKHPAYRKEPMELPSNKHQEMPEYYDMNDESAKSEEPFGQQIGDGAPFEIDPDEITNAIAESIKRVLKKKI